jgi:predicted dehydrogenase
MHRVRASYVALTFFIVILSSRSSAADEQAEPIKVGIIGLDSYHALAFTQLFHAPKAEGGLAGIRVVAAFPGGSPDIAESAENLPKWLEQIKPYGVQIVDSIADLLPKVDAVMITSLDGRPHLEQARAVIAAGKPLFIDRPLAASLADAVEIFRLAREHGVPICSCSQHRFSPGFIGMRNHPEVGRVLGCDVYGGCPREEHHPDLYWHSIHGGLPPTTWVVAHMATERPGQRSHARMPRTRGR